jgi:glycosyltransferase 2 family protein
LSVLDNSSNLKKYTSWKLWLGLLISGVSIYLALRKVDLSALWKVISGSNVHYFFLACLINLLLMFLRAWRWKILLGPIKKTGFSNRFLSILIGFAGNCVLPARLGEFIRADVLGQRESISKSSTFATIVVERLADGFTLLLILLIGILGVQFPENMMPVSTGLKSAGLTLFCSYVLIIIFIIGFKMHPEVYLKVLNKLLFFLPSKLKSRAIDIMRRFELGLTPVKGLYGWTMLLAYSLILWSLSLLQIQFIEHSIGISLPFISTFIILSMASFGVMIPSAPGYIGAFHLAVQYGFMFFGVSREVGLSAAILYHASFFFPTILFGIIAYVIVNLVNHRKVDLK